MGMAEIPEEEENPMEAVPPMNPASYLREDEDMPALRMPPKAQSGASAGAGAKPAFKPTTRASINPAKKKAPVPGTAASTEGTGASGNVFFASSLGGEPEEVVMTLEPTPTAPGKTKPNPNLPKYMQPVPKKRDRR